MSRKPNGGSVVSIWERDDHRCWICEHGVRRDEATRDHVQPRGMGGYDKAKNYRLAHARCNVARSRVPADIVVKIRNSLGGAPSADAMRQGLTDYRARGYIK